MAQSHEALSAIRGCLARGELDAAEALLAPWLQSEPSEPEWLRLWGIVAGLRGDHGLAEQCHRRCCELAPEHVEYRHNLATTLLAMRRFDESAQLAAQVLTQQPQLAPAAVVLGHALLELKQYERAAEAYRRALQLVPEMTQASVNLGCALEELHRYDEAEGVYRAALPFAREMPELAFNLGNVLEKQGRLDEAEQSFRRAVELRPDYSQAWGNLGSVLQMQEQLDEAESAYRQALALLPRYANAWNNLGTIYNARKQYPAAIDAYRQAVEIEPQHVEAWSNLGNALDGAGQPAAAIAALERAITLDENYADAWYNLGTALLHQEQCAAAEAALQRTLELKPEHGFARINLGKIWQSHGDVTGAIEQFRQACELLPDFAIAGSNLLSSHHYRWNVTPAELLTLHEQWNERYAAALAPQFRPTWPARKDRRLRVGFVSADFGYHPVTRFVLPMFEGLDPQRCVKIAYSDRIEIDPLTERVRQSADEWRGIFGASDEQVAEQMRRDELDIFVDLAGHTARNRLLVFARRVAPLQVTWLGYEGTTGLTEMDVLIADRFTIPPELEPHYRERVVRMPHDYVTYLPPLHDPTVAELPCERRGYVTFGSISNPAKLNDDVLQTWAELLRRVDNARLLLMFRHLDEPAVSERFLAKFREQGIAPERIELRGWQPPRQFYACYSEIDVVVDPWPFNGGATTCDALWMGVPVLTWPRETFASRHSLSHLSNIGITETIAQSRSDYVARGVELAGDMPRLRHYRQTLREQLRHSPLCAGEAFANDWLDRLTS